MQPNLLPPSQPAQTQLVTQLLLLAVHWTFEAWFIRQVQAGLIPEDEPFTIKGLRQQYLEQCWKDELLLKQWSETNGKS